MNRVVSIPASNLSPWLRTTPLRSAAIASALLTALFAHPAVADDQADHFFETEIRPILVNHCVACHGATESNGGLRLDSKAAFLKGGDTGPAALPGAETSLLLKAVRRTDDLAMPPDDPLSRSQVASLTKWVELGLPWPDDGKRLATAAELNAKDHWAFQPVKNPSVPDFAKSSASNNPIDAFVRKRLHENDLAISPEADRRTLIRRLSYTLTGLPPALADVESFMADNSAEAYTKLVDQYLG